MNKLLLGILNHLLGQAQWARARLQPFAGRQVRFDMPPWQLAFSVNAEGYFSPVSTDNIDVTIALPADTPLTALQSIDKAVAAAHITGNAEFAEALSFVLKNLRWDAEEDLSRILGDIAAHRIVSAATKLATWQQQATRRFAENFAAFLGNEARLLTPRHEFTAFQDDLAALTTRLDALAKIESGFR